MPPTKGSALDPFYGSGNSAVGFNPLSTSYKTSTSSIGECYKTSDTALVTPALPGYRLKTCETREAPFPQKAPPVTAFPSIGDAKLDFPAYLCIHNA